MNLKEDPVILFDGVCNLCNGAVQFIIRHDKKKLFHFAPLQGPTATTLLKNRLHPENAESIVLVENATFYFKSTAALRIARKLKGWPVLLYGFIIVPPFIRDRVYDLIARKRYAWFGKQDSCMIPTPELMNRFLK